MSVWVTGLGFADLPILEEHGENGICFGCSSVGGVGGRVGGLGQGLGGWGDVMSCV